MHRTYLRLLFCAALSACEAGGTAHGAASLPAAPAGAPASGTSKATLSIKLVVPERAPGNFRKAAYVGAGTQSVTVTVAPSGGNPGAPQLITCSSGACSGTVGAPAGSDTVTVKLYDQPLGGGNLLSTGATTVVAGSGATTNVNLTFNPVVSTFTFAASGSFPAGTAGTLGVSAVAYDPDGNTIVGPGSYVDSAGNPLTITLGGLIETGGNTTLSLSGNRTFTSPSSTAATLTYNGNSSYGATFTGSSSPARGMLAGTPLAVSGYEITEYTTPTPAAYPWWITNGPDGNMWFTENATNKIAKLMTNGTMVEYAASGGTEPGGITAGPDGRLWFTEETAHKIGRINTDGTGYVEYAAAGGSEPEAIVTGPDGNLWFTDEANNAIGVMSTNGVLLHNYTAGISAGALGDDFNEVSIIVGPDGNLWFTETLANKVARITTSGTVTEFPDASGTNALVIGSDGNLWNAGATAGISVLNTSGTILHTYGYPTDAVLSNAFLSEAVRGNDGNIWVTDFNNPIIYSVSIGNAVTPYSNGISGGAQCNVIVSGRDGNLWFTEFATSKVARLVY